MKGGRTIVVLLHQGMGDTLMGIPLLRNCEAGLGSGDCLIVFVKSELEMEVIDSVQWVGNIEVWKVPRGGIKSSFGLINTALKIRKRHPSVVIAPLLADRLKNLCWMKLIGSGISAGQTGKWARFAFSRPLKKEPGFHHVDFFLHCGAEAGFSQIVEPDIRIPVSEELQMRARSKMPGWNADQKWIALGPGSGERESFKRWPASHFRELVGLLLGRSEQIRIALFGSPEERGLLESIVSGTDFDTSRCFCFPDERFGSALSLVSQCHCMVAGCAGPLHMAAAAGIPVVGLYGPSNPGLEGAYCKRHYAVRVGLECSPCCGEGPNKSCVNPICMSLIRPESVYRAVTDTLDGLFPPPVPWIPVAKVDRSSISKF